MQSLRELASRYDTDKATNDGYLRDFEAILGPLRDRDVTLLELGVLTGGSLRMWRDYFPSGRIVGLDVNEVAVEDASGRIRTYRGRQDDAELLDRIRAEQAADGFDIVIDDCSHLGEPTRASFWHLFRNHLKPGGIYCIEDWGTGYWPSWPDGSRLGRRGGPQARRSLHRLAVRLSAVGPLQRTPVARRVAMRLERALVPRRFASHDSGMVGFVKQLIDEVGIADATAPGRGAGTHRESLIPELRISQGHVFVFKAPAGDVAGSSPEDQG